MTRFNKKQKIIIGIFIVVVAIVAIYYSYKQENNFLEETENLEIENQAKEGAEESEETTEKEKIIVHISGAVQNEGIVELESGSRVADAIEKAGGLKENAYMDEINLAYQLEDGEKIHIPTVEEQKEKENQESKVENESGTGSDGTTSRSSNSSINNGSQNEKTSNQTKININTATEQELDSLPGIGPSTAAKILEYRKEKGKFKTIEEIKEVSGIGESKYEKIKDRITVK